MLYKKDQNGFAIIYGLMVLFFVTIGGMSILFISGKDKESSGDYIKMREANMAANAACKAFESLCDEKPDSLLKLLTKFKSDQKYKWLFTSNINGSSSERKILLGNNSMFSAKIISFDTTDYVIQIETYGYGSGKRGGKKKVSAIYKLNGIKIEAAPLPIPAHALYLGGGFGNCDSPLKIDGNVYAGKTINGSGGLTINGNLKTSNEDCIINNGLTVIGNTYLRGGSITISGGPTPYNFNGKVGIEKTVNIQKDKVFIKNNLYLNGTAHVHSNQNKFILQNNTDTVFHVNFNVSKNTSATHIVKVTPGPIDIASELNMTNHNDVPPSVQPNLESYINDNGGHIYTITELKNYGLNFDKEGWNLEKVYNTVPSNTIWNDFLVIKVDPTSQGVFPGSGGYYFNTNASGGTFGKKAIWIMDNIKCIPKGWYASDPGSNTLIYLKNGASLGEFNFGSSKTFRGLIYEDSNVSNIYKFGESSKIHGAIIHKGTGGFQGGTCHIKYDTKVLEEFANLGIFEATAGTTSSSTPNSFILDDIKIRPHLLSMAF